LIFSDTGFRQLTQMLLPPVIVFHASEYILARAIHGPSRGKLSLSFQFSSAFNTFAGSSLQPPILVI
ncbi:unnamed protein product, partial [Brassica oleracea]